MTDSTDKPIVQIINQLRDYNANNANKLLPIDRLILIYLVSHKGQNGIFPSQIRLAKEVGTSRRYLIERIKYLQKLNLITVTRSRHNHYIVNLLTQSYPQIGDPQITSQKSTCDPQITSNVIHRSPDMSAVDHPNSRGNSKKNREGALSDFEIKIEDQERCKAKGIDAEMVKQKFILHAQANGKRYSDVDAAFRLWVDREKATTKPMVSAATATPKCITCRLSEFSCRCRVSSREVAAERMKHIMGMLKANRV